MKQPGPLAVQGNYLLVLNLKITQSETGKLSQHFIVIAGQVGNLGVSFGDEAGQVFDHQHMRLRPISFAELPHVNNVTIQYQTFGLYGLEVPKKLFRVAAIGA